MKRGEGTVKGKTQEKRVKVREMAVKRRIGEDCEREDMDRKGQWVRREGKRGKTEERSMRERK